MKPLNRDSIAADMDRDGFAVIDFPEPDLDRSSDNRSPSSRLRSPPLPRRSVAISKSGNAGSNLPSRFQLFRGDLRQYYRLKWLAGF
jgi:hypothetical protein